MFRNAVGICNASTSSGVTWPPWPNARGSAHFDSPKEGVPFGVALRCGNGIDACVEIWFAGI